MQRLSDHESVDTRPRLRVARNPDPESRRPYLIWLPIEGGMVLNARETWPRANRVFCARDAALWDEAADLLDDVPVLLCRRRGVAIDLVLDRPSFSRSQFVFIEARGRPAIWWQTQKAVQAANPGARIPRGRAAGALTVAIDTREKYGWKFAGRSVTVLRRALPAGDYAAVSGEDVLVVVERKTLENLANSLSMAASPFRCSAWPRWPERRSRSKVTTRTSFGLPRRGSWLADMLGRLAIRYPEVPIVFAGSRRFAEGGHSVSLGQPWPIGQRSYRLGGLKCEPQRRAASMHEASGRSVEPHNSTVMIDVTGNGSTTVTLSH